MLARDHYLTKFFLTLMLLTVSCLLQADNNTGRQEGYASYYSDYFHGKTTANGETFNQQALTAAHKTLPFGTRVQVVRTDTGQTVDVVINDRGPFVDGRIIDLSKRAARQIDMLDNGVAPVIISWKTD